MFLTAQLVFVILMLAVEKQKSTFLAPVSIGLAVIVGQMVGIYYTGASLNPARTFGPDVIVGFPHYHWIYCIFYLTRKKLTIGGWALPWSSISFRFLQYDESSRLWQSKWDSRS